MNKIICIGDTHGQQDWKEITMENPDADFIFLGDYFDSFNIPGQEQCENYLDIIQYKKNNPDRVTLLIGNHDISYLLDEHCSGFQRGFQYEIKRLLEDNLGLMQVCKALPGYYLCVHAGVTNAWCRKNEIDQSNLVESINERFKYKPNSFLFSGRDPHGDDISQGPMWVRPRALTLNMIDGWTQIVGHTVVKQLTMAEVILIDTMQTSKEYLEIGIDGVPVAKKTGEKKQTPLS